MVAMDNQSKCVAIYEVLRKELQRPIRLRVNTGGLRNRKDVEVTIADAMKFLVTIKELGVIKEEILKPASQANKDYLLSLEIVLRALKAPSRDMSKLVSLASASQGPQLKLELLRAVEASSHQVVIAFSQKMLSDTFIYRDKYGQMTYPLRHQASEYLKRHKVDHLIPINILIHSSDTAISIRTLSQKLFKILITRRFECVYHDVWMNSGCFERRPTGLTGPLGRCDGSSCCVSREITSLDNVVWLRRYLWAAAIGIDERKTYSTRG